MAKIKYDYKVLQLPTGLNSVQIESELDKLGAAGWELVAITGILAVFKKVA